VSGSRNCMSSTRALVGKMIERRASNDFSPVPQAPLSNFRMRNYQANTTAFGFFRIGNLIKSTLLMLGFVCSLAPASAEYKIDVGDVIEIMVARVPELQRRVSVRSDGSISFPMLGTLLVAGLSPSEVEAQIKASLATRVFRQRMSDGRENAVTIEPDEVTAAVAQYRPIYVNGDVSKPGEQGFRPSMTVRQAVALSGGYDILRLRNESPVLLSADLRGEYESLWTEFAKERAQLSRLNTELGDNDTLDEKLLTDVPIPPTRKAEIVRVEAEHLRTELADYEREKTFLRHTIKQADEQIKVLSEQNTSEEKGVQADVEELQRINELFGKGSLPSPRVTDARRAVLLSSTRKLQTSAQLMQVKKQQDDIARQLERLDDLRRIKLLQDLQDARTRFAQLRAKLQSTGEKVLYTAAKSQLVRGNELKPEFTVIRKGKSGGDRITADYEFELEPGDVVEVSLRFDDVAGTVNLAQTTEFAMQKQPTTVDHEPASTTAAAAVSASVPVPPRDVGPSSASAKATNSHASR